MLGLGILWMAVAGAQETQAPRRPVPPSVLAELATLESRFEVALAADCEPDQCFSRGCAYVAHAVADRPRAGSLHGLGQAMQAPEPVEPQSWLTQARCSFAHEAALEPERVSALARRLQAKVSAGFAVVSVGHQVLAPLPEPPEAEPEPEPPPPEPVSWTRELWTSLLDDFDWMIAVGLVTLAGVSLIWAWRRVGRESLEERALLAQLERGDDEPDAEAPEPADSNDDDEGEALAWRQRLAAMDRAHLQAMIRELLRDGELPLLAKAVLTFPETLPGAFPTGGDIAEAKLELAEYLKHADPAALPSDAELVRALSRHALSAALSTQRDAEIVRSLREEFGPTGLVALIGGVPPRAAALLFALAPPEAQHETVRLLTPRQLAGMAEQLLRSNRMDPSETAYLFEVLEAARADAPLPSAPDLDVADHGAEFDATRALSVLLPRLDGAHRARLFERALQQFGGSLPAWYQAILLPEMLLQLPDEARADLLLGVDIEALAAWLSLVDEDLRQVLFEGVPGSLRASVQAASVFPSRARQLALADSGRQALAKGFQAQLARGRVPFEQVVRTLAAGGP